MGQEDGGRSRIERPPAPRVSASVSGPSLAFPAARPRLSQTSVSQAASHLQYPLR